MDIKQNISSINHVSLFAGNLSTPSLSHLNTSLVCGEALKNKELNHRPFSDTKRKITYINLDPTLYNYTEILSTIFFLPFSSYTLISEAYRNEEHSYTPFSDMKGESKQINIHTFCFILFTGNLSTSFFFPSIAVSWAVNLT